MRVVLFGGYRDGDEWFIAGPLALPDGQLEYARTVPLGGMPSGSTGDGWGPMPTWIYVLTDEVRTIDGEAVRVMRQDRRAAAVEPERASREAEPMDEDPLHDRPLSEKRRAVDAMADLVDEALVGPDRRASRVLPIDPASPFFRAPARKAR